jgi:serine/threonine-protein kinase HipA
MKGLTVWNGTDFVGSLTFGRSGLSFRYSADLLDRWGLGIPLISLSMPTSARPYPDRVARPFFDGLLPEGQARRIIAFDARIAEADTFGLLAHLGRECAGALAVLPDGEVPGEAEPIDSLVSLTPAELERRIADLQFHPLGVDGAVRVSLGGVQDKLLLTQLSNGGWALPTLAVASTHILKPEPSGLSGAASNEAFCLRLAERAGVRAASAEVLLFAGRSVLVVERFDRFVDSTGCVRRVHQENACQALNVPVASPARKYEDSGGPSLGQIAKLLRRWGISSATEELLKQTAVNVLLGNADAHAMNHSFVLGGGQRAALSPMYDVFSTVSYPQFSTTPGMFINGKTDIRSVSQADLLAEAKLWGLRTSRAEDLLETLTAKMVAGIDPAASQVVNVPEGLVGAIRQRLADW